jgi:dihydrofolate reductase
VRKLILKMSISLDGFVCGPNGELDWIFSSTGKDSTSWTVDKVWQAGAHLMGHKTFNDMAAHWPSSTGVFAAPMNEIPKIVFSANGFDPSIQGETTGGLEDAAKNRTDSAAATLPASAKSWKEPTIITGDLATGIRRLKAETGKELLAHGGAGFAQSLTETGLIDEFWLLTHPVAIGRGKGLFTSLKAPVRLKLIDTKPFDAGTVAHIYESAG